jgi:hypothetical protein
MKYLLRDGEKNGKLMEAEEQQKSATLTFTVDRRF